jgi:two-component system chemotaxis response regulator CheB
MDPHGSQHASSSPLSPLTVVEARDGLELSPGMVVVARAGMHLRLARRGKRIVADLDLEPATALHRPSVDVLFESVASFGPGALAVVLTGMGNDGLEGCRAIHRAGGTILTEAESSCVIYGMPRSVHEAGLSDGEVPLEQMAAEILKRI